MKIQKIVCRMLGMVAVVCMAMSAHAAGERPDWANLTEREIVMDQLIVVYRDEAVAPKGQRIGLENRWRSEVSPASIRGVHRAHRAQVNQRYQIIAAEEIHLPEGSDLAAVAAAYEANPDVVAVYPNYRIYASAIVPNDALWDELWGMVNMGADEAWDYFSVTDRQPIVVAVIDSGIRLDHPDLQGRFWTNPVETLNGEDDDGNGYVDDICGWDFVDNNNDPSDENGHGTHVAGTIAAVMNNGIGVVGVSQAVQLLPVRVLGADGTGSLAGMAAAVQYISIGVVGAHVRLSNNSLGSFGHWPFLQEMIEINRQAGQLFVAAAGNESVNIDIVASQPGGLPNENIVCVASINELETLSNFSNYGVRNVDIAAPGGTGTAQTGREIMSTWHVDQGANGPYNAISGTSMASPHVAGAAAYLWALNPSLTYQQIAGALYAGATVNPALQGRVGGARQLQLMGSIEALLVSPPVPNQFYGHPHEGFPISGGGLSSGTMSSVWDEDCTVDLVFDEGPDSWLSLVEAPLALLAGETAPWSVVIDPDAPGFPTVPGTYTNSFTVTFTPLTQPPYSVTRSVVFRLSKTYFLQSAPHAWVEMAPGVNLTSSVQTGAAVALPPGFNFTFYDKAYSSLFIRPNGAILFENPALPLAATGTVLPEANAKVAGVFPYWTATSLIGGGVYGQAGTVDGRPAYVVTWSNVAHSANSATRFDYQVVLFDVGPDECSEIWYQYRKVGQQDSLNGMGLKATVGLQSDSSVLAAHYGVNGAWTTAPGMEYDPCPGWVEGTPMRLADAQTLRWTWGERIPETVPPTVVFTPVLALPDEMHFELRFSEIVFGLTTGDLLLQSSIAGMTINSLVGGGERYLVVILNPDYHLGFLSLQLRNAAVFDLEENWNVGTTDSGPSAFPNRVMHVVDNFERGPGLWNASSSEGTTEFTSNGWEFGVPYPSVVGGPFSAFSGIHCWGTLLGREGWTSASGVPNGHYPGETARAMNASLESPSFHVGNNPAITVRAFWRLPGATATILAVPITAGGPTAVLGTLEPGSTSLGQWTELRYRLPASLFNQHVKIKFVVQSQYDASGVGLYIDNFALYSVADPGVYFVQILPSPLLTPAVATPAKIVAYNSSYGPVADVEGLFASPVAGITVGVGDRVKFAPMLPGGLATSSVPVSVAASAAPFDSLTVPIQGTSFVRGVVDQLSSVPLYLNGPLAGTGKLLLAKTDSFGVKDWLGRPLQGDGGAASASYQILWVGPDGVINPPAPDGSPTGDDRVLYSAGPGHPVERFGSVGVAADAGLFSRSFSHGLASNAVLYARAWDGPSFDRSVAYGNSARRTITAVQGETVNFGSWVVATPTQFNRDWNGDGIPDGYAVTHPAFGLDPRYVPDPAANPLRVISATTSSKAGYRPIRVETFNNRTYILYLNNTANENGAIEVRDLSLSNLLQTVTNISGTSNPLQAASGLTVDRVNSKLYVTEASTAGRIYRFGIGGAGLLTYEATVQHPAPFRPRDIAVLSDGRVYIADNTTSIKRYEPLLAGNPVSVLFNSPATTDRVSAFGSHLYRSFLDSTYQFHRVQRYGLPAGTLGMTFGFPPVVPDPKTAGYLNAPAKVAEGVGGRAYVADRGNHRIQVFGSDGVFQAMLPAGPPAASSAIGRFNHPTGIWVTSDPFGDHVIYVADENNNRVQRLVVILDVDADGMDDTWEDLHGLDPTDPADALLDNDGDGLSNLGEYRLRRDPNDPDTDNDGRSDSYDLYEPPKVPVGSVPAVVTAPYVTAAVNELGICVFITIYYDKDEPLNDPIQISLSGGAYLHSAPMTRAGATATYAYTVQPGDSGWVTVSIAGAYQDPPVYTKVDAFELQGAQGDITLLSLTATPTVSGVDSLVQISAIFDGDVSDAAVTIHSAEGAVVLNAAPMAPAAPVPTAQWSYGVSTGPVLTNAWFVVSATSSGAPGDSPLRAAYAVVDPTVTAFSAPPPSMTWTALTGLVYRVEATTNLVNGTWATVLQTNAVGTLSATEPLTVGPPDGGEPVLFFRIAVP